MHAITRFEMRNRQTLRYNIYIYTLFWIDNLMLFMTLHMNKSKACKRKSVRAFRYSDKVCTSLGIITNSTM